MTEVSVSDFRKDLKKYAEIVKTQDLIVVSNGKPIMKISDPSKNKRLRMKGLRGIAKSDITAEDVLKEKINEL